MPNEPSKFVQILGGGAAFVFSVAFIAICIILVGVLTNVAIRLFEIGYDLI